MGRIIYFFGTSGDIAASTYNAADQAAMTPTGAPDVYQAAPIGTVTLESKVDPKKGENQTMLVNSVNTSDVGATGFDYLGQIIEVPSVRQTYIKGSQGDVIVADDGL